MNRQSVRRRGDLARPPRAPSSPPRTSAWSAADPSGRRDLLDETLAAARPRRPRRSAEEIEKVLRQRAALLRQSGGRAERPTSRSTLDVWDQRLADAGKVLVEAREELVATSAPGRGRAYSRLAGAAGRGPGHAALPTGAGTGDLLDALAASRDSTTCGGGDHGGAPPRRPDLALDGREARTPRLPGGAALPGARPAPRRPHARPLPDPARSPVLLLDDVFSELDPARSRALVAELPPGQSLLTTAAPLPEGHRRGHAIVPAVQSPCEAA